MNIHYKNLNTYNLLEVLVDDKNKDIICVNVKTITITIYTKTFSNYYIPNILAFRKQIVIFITLF